MNLPDDPFHHWRKGFRRISDSALGLVRYILHAKGRFSFTRISASLLLLAFLFTGCMRHETPADLVIVNGIEPETLDPALVLGVAEMRIVSSMYEGLLRLDPKNAKPIPGLASSWEVSPDKRVYTFHLRTNLVWSTGEPITSADVVYSWIRAISPETASDYAGQLFPLKNAEDFNAGKITDSNLVGVHALDRFTIRTELKSPTAYWLDLCAFPTLSVVPRQTIDKYGDNWIMAKPLPVDGPYELVTWRINDKIRVKKNPRYWDAANTHINVADFLPIGSATTALNLYMTGAADVVWDKDLVPNELLDILLKRPDFHTFNYLGTYFIRCNTTRKPFDDIRVRQALSLALDRERITKKITRAGEVPAYNFTPPGIGNYHAPPGLRYDPAEARKLLAEAGYPGGKGFPRFTYMFNAAAGGADKLHADIGVEMQQMWHDELGIDMELHQVEWKVYLAEEGRKNYDLTRASWIGDYNDPNTFLNLFVSTSGNNRTGWKSDRYDELIRLSDQEPDPAQREKYLQEAETILLHDTPVIPIFFYVGFNYYNPEKIHGIYNNLLDIHPLNAIWRTPTTNSPEAKP
jgi:oligopeptide transport system substrate-binding protein